MDRLRIYIRTECHDGVGNYKIAIYRNGNYSESIDGNVSPITANRLELLATTEALESVIDKCSVLILTDSDYVMECLVDKKDKRKNRDLYQRFMSKTSKRVTIKKVTNVTLRKHTP